MIYKNNSGAVILDKMLPFMSIGLLLLSIGLWNVDKWDSIVVGGAQLFLLAKMLFWPEKYTHTVKFYNNGISLNNGKVIEWNDVNRVHFTFSQDDKKREYEHLYVTINGRSGIKKYRIDQTFNDYETIKDKILEHSPDEDEPFSL